VSEPRTAKLLRLGFDQIVEVPSDWEFPSGEVVIVKDGDRLIVTPKDDSSRSKGPIDAPAPRP
jgi:virulence-associated protein VagC